VAGLALTLVVLLLRVVAGVPLPVELISDRVVPQLGVRTFGRLLGRVGGPLRGKNLAFLSSFGIQLGAAAVGGAVFGLLGPRLRRPWFVVALAMAGLWLLSLLVLWPVLASNYRGLAPGWSTVASAAGLLLALEVFGTALISGFFSLARARPAGERRESAGLARRAFLLGGLGVLGSVAAAGLAGLLYRRATFGAFGYDGLQLRGPRVDPITPNERFYVVTKNLVDPRPVDPLWRLQITGLVERPRDYSLDDLVRLGAVRQEQTLECISNRVGAGLISNAVWTGVPMRSLLETAGVKPGVRRVAMHASDGYVHTISLEKAVERTTLVAYRMNGRELPLRHGYPARVLVPGTYGEVSVKWVDRIDLSGEAIEGYYEQQGWQPYMVKTMSRIDSPRPGAKVGAAQTLNLRGIAFAGDRGISKVEVNTGSGWTPARIDYSPSPLAWSLWSAVWRAPGPGRYRIAVRAIDGTGALQTATAHGAVPAGATGYHTVPVEVTA
jgi:DMSO/TMAO reductase YedYZ molybdopterin-dependent catalytic subunit